MIVSIHQPAYLPWLGYLDRIAQADIFVFLDTVQFEKNSFTNRNRIKTANGPTWLTVPVLKQGHINKALTEIEIDDTSNWRQKHLRSIEQNYRRAAHFLEHQEKLSALYAEGDHALPNLCYKQLLFWLAEFSIPTQIVKASELGVPGHKAELVLNLCKHLGADTYISGPFGRDYLDADAFHDAKIELKFHDYVHVEYRQLYGAFLGGMGIPDYWLNDGDPSIFQTDRSKP